VNNESHWLLVTGHLEKLLIPNDFPLFPMTNDQPL